MKNIGLIGCGIWGKNILRDLISQNCMVYVVDINAQACDRAINLGAAAAYLNIAALPECDGYVVSVPIPDLARESAELLRFKKPVFVEKTLCLSLADYNLLKDRGGKKYLFAMHKWHYHPGIEALRLVAQSGRIGAIRELTATRYGWVNDFHGGDVFWTQAVHDLTIVKHILGRIPEEVRAINVIKNPYGQPVSLTAVLGEDPTVVLAVSGQHCYKISGVCLQGSRGAAGLKNAYDDHITIRDESGEYKEAIDTTFPLFLELKEFVTHLHGGPQPRCGLEEAKEVTLSLLKLRKLGGLI